MMINDPVLHAEVTATFHAYEQALMADDIAVMDALFHDAPTTIRFGANEVLYGSDEIRAYRRGRGGAAPRRLGRVEIVTYGKDFATTHAEFVREGVESRGRQSQSWVRFSDGWKIVSAHVSTEQRGTAQLGDPLAGI